MCNCGSIEPPPPQPSRRGFMFTLGSVLVSTGSLLAALPIIGFVFAPLTKKTVNEPIDLGPLTQFPAGETRLASYKNPERAPWDGYTDNIPCWVRHIQDEKFQLEQGSFQLTQT